MLLLFSQFSVTFVMVVLSQLTGTYSKDKNIRFKLLLFILLYYMVFK